MTRTRPRPLGIPPAHAFITADVETEAIVEGVQALSAIRNRVERRTRVEIPMTWFVRFQRTWNEYVDIDAPEYFARPLNQSFDGFRLAARQLRRLQARGDEIGWHYHAYNYVHRDELSHPQKVAILRADLAACGTELRQRHPEFSIRTFRWGWFFVPDYDLYAVLRAAGIRVDASIDPALSETTVNGFRAKYLPALTDRPREIAGTWFVPRANTQLVHDYEVVAHDLGWTRQGEPEAAGTRAQWEATLERMAHELRRAGGAFLTYEQALNSVSLGQHFPVGAPPRA
jgi:hypothetical protein